MGRLLSTEDLARLEVATRALLSPLAFATTDDWRDEVMRTTTEALGARGASFMVGDEPEVARNYDMPDDFRQRLADYTAATWRHEGPSLDPIIDEFYGWLGTRQDGVWSMASADHLRFGGQGRVWSTLFYHEALHDFDAGGTHGIFVPRAPGGAMLSVIRLPGDPASDEHFPVLRLLQPALRAGLDARDRLAAHRAALDATDDALVAFGPDGAETYRTPAFERLLASDPERLRVDEALRTLAYRVRPLAFARLGEGAAARPLAAEVGTERARYLLRAALLPPSAFSGTDAFLVTVEASGAAVVFPTADVLRERAGLTRREAEVALLVSQGLPNDAIAARLFVSSHTVRHHVENAMAKLGLTGCGRESVAARLLDPAA